MAPSMPRNDSLLFFQHVCRKSKVDTSLLMAVSRRTGIVQAGVCGVRCCSDQRSLYFFVLASVPRRYICRSAVLAVCLSTQAVRITSTLFSYFWCLVSRIVSISGPRFLSACPLERVFHLTRILTFNPPRTPPLTPLPPTRTPPAPHHPPSPLQQAGREVLNSSWRYSAALAPSLGLVPFALRDKGRRFRALVRFLYDAGAWGVASAGRPALAEGGEKIAAAVSLCELRVRGGQGRANVYLRFVASIYLVCWFSALCSFFFVLFFSLFVFSYFPVFLFFIILFVFLFASCSSPPHSPPQGTYEAVT